jgi:ribonuclease Z
MKVTMLGTGHAMVTELYNTCFTMENTTEPAAAATPAGEEQPVFLVDAGGGNTVLNHLKHSGIKISRIHDVFVTHHHVDHMMGVPWIVRAITSDMSRGTYVGEARIYSHPALSRLLEDFCKTVIDARQAKFIGDRLKFVPVEDGDTHEVIGHPVTFFDLGPECKVREFGFQMVMEDGRKVTMLGDETCHPAGQAYLEGSYLAMHEAFCLDAEESKYHPYQIAHSTVKTACQIAQAAGVQNLVLYHTEDSHGADRKALYLEEGKRYFDGLLRVPDDMESFEF